jgi:hypothetical protein
VQTKQLYGTLIFVRKASLRGLNPDETLVLVNGKRQHRAPFVDFNILGGGAQGVDLSQINRPLATRYRRFSMVARTSGFDRSRRSGVTTPPGRQPPRSRHPGKNRLNHKAAHRSGGRRCHAIR